MRIYNRRDFYAGNRMGPGYFPTLLAGIMLFLGVAVLVMAFLPKEAQDPPEATDWRGIGLVLSSVAGFALLLPVAGFLIAICFLVFVSAAASHESNKKETVLLAIALAALGIAVFGYGIELQFPILPPFLTR